MNHFARTLQKNLNSNDNNDTPRFLLSKEKKAVDAKHLNHRKSLQQYAC